MCGIFGFTVKFNNSQDKLDIMGKTMRHRGPDGEGYYADEYVSLGMKRLSIIDIKKGGQPFFNKNKTVVVICNGEIYNFKELKKELQLKGYSFSTNSDIEVIPHLYDEYGINFVDKLNGMYAIALYDKATESLYLIRDRLGIKPLYYSIVNNEIVFASELKSILSLGIVKKDLDFSALSVYLDLLYIPRPLTPFKSIKKLESASYLYWQNGAFKIHKYWDISLKNSDKRKDADYGEAIEKLLRDSVQKELISDVPVGSYLSGGIDSSLITALAAQLSDKKFYTYHMQWDKIKDKIDESFYAKIISDRFKTENITTSVRKIDVASCLPKLIWHLDEPFADAAFIPMYLLSSSASGKVKAMLNGAGGDELFGGYNHYAQIPAHKKLLYKLLPWKKLMGSYDVWKNKDSRFFKKIFSWYEEDCFKSKFDRKYQENYSKDRANALMLNDVLYYLQDDILFYTDKMSMAASIECRVPFLDHRVVEYCSTIPSRLKVGLTGKKLILKKIAERFLPHEVIYREKEGFGAPVGEWINEYKEKYFDKILNDSFLIKDGLMDQTTFNNNFSMACSEPFTYWKILILEIWYRIFIKDINYSDVFTLYQDE